MKSIKLRAMLAASVLVASTLSSVGYAADVGKAVQMQEGVYLSQPRTDIINFTLTDNHGKPFTRDNLKGHWTMMFFGFTNCGMVCPTTLAALRDMYHTLQKKLPADQLPQVVMVSVDPARDSVARMNDYVNSFDSHFIGARADITETVKLEKNLHIAAAKIESNGHYTINHSAEILLFNPLGQLQAFLSYPHHAPQMVKDYQDILLKDTFLVLKK